MPFTHTRTIRLSETDAAGVVFFARIPALCHEAYEEALAFAGIQIGDLLGTTGIIVPIARCEAEYLRPLRPGDKVRVTLSAEPLSADSFAIRFEVYRIGTPEKIAARVRTEHVCTSPAKRSRAALPAPLAAWVKAG